MGAEFALFGFTRVDAKATAVTKKKNFVGWICIAAVRDFFILLPLSCPRPVRRCVCAGCPACSRSGAGFLYTRLRRRSIMPNPSRALPRRARLAGSGTDHSPEKAPPETPAPG